MPVKCYRCGTIIPEGEPNCPNCGSPVAFTDDEIAATKRRDWAVTATTAEKTTATPASPETTPISIGIPANDSETTPIHRPAPPKAAPTTPDTGIPAAPAPGIPVGKPDEPAHTIPLTAPQHAPEVKSAGEHVAPAAARAKKTAASNRKLIFAGITALALLGLFMWFSDGLPEPEPRNISFPDIRMQSLSADCSADAAKIGLPDVLSPAVRYAVVTDFRRRNYLPAYDDRARYIYDRTGTGPGNEYRPYIVFRHKDGISWLVMPYTVTGNEIRIDENIPILDHNPEPSEI